jgi:hypothetical protein
MAAQGWIATSRPANAIPSPTCARTG